MLFRRPDLALIRGQLAPADGHAWQRERLLRVRRDLLDALGAHFVFRATAELIARVANDSSLVQSSAYFSFYLLRALKQAGLGDEYVARLAPWHQMIAEGFTTFPEIFKGARSDCHAWSASPLYELLATVCGIEPASAGFATVRIEPHLGPLQHAEGKVAHPKGEIIAKLQRAGAGVKAEITLPAGVTGTFVWGEKSVSLKGGAQTITLP